MSHMPECSPPCLDHPYCSHVTQELNPEAQGMNAVEASGRPAVSVSVTARGATEATTVRERLLGASAVIMDALSDALGAVEAADAVVAAGPVGAEVGQVWSDMNEAVNEANARADRAEATLMKVANDLGATLAKIRATPSQNDPFHVAMDIADDLREVLAATGEHCALVHGGRQRDCSKPDGCCAPCGCGGPGVALSAWMNRTGGVDAARALMEITELCDVAERRARWAPGGNAKKPSITTKRLRKIMGADPAPEPQADSKPGREAKHCRTCAGSGWYGSREHDPEHYSQHIHCECGAICRACALGDGFASERPTALDSFPLADPAPGPSGLTVEHAMADDTLREQAIAAIAPYFGDGQDGMDEALDWAPSNPGYWAQKVGAHFTAQFEEDAS